MVFFESAQEIVAGPNHNDTGDAWDARGVDPGIGIGAIHLYAVLINPGVRSGISGEKKALFMHQASIAPCFAGMCD